MILTRSQPNLKSNPQLDLQPDLQLDLQPDLQPDLNFNPDRILKSNELLFLNTPETIWQVKSGALALFAVHMHHQQPQGKRRYLSSVQSGELLFSSKLQDNVTSSYQIFVVALEETILCPIEMIDFYGQVLATPHRAVRQMESWIYRLGSMLSGIDSPKIQTPIGGCGILAQGEIYQPAQGEVVWVKFLQGHVHLLGLESVELTPNQGRIPLTSHLWVQAQGIVEIESCSKISISSPDVFFTGLSHLQQLVLQGIEHCEDRENQQERDRFSDKLRIDQNAIKNTYQEFDKLFEQTKQIKRDDRAALITNAVNTENAALLVAAGAVGHALGIEIFPPSASEDQRRVQEPLESIARASRIRIRRVVLRDDWWKKDNGPLLAYMEDDRRPVALLPLGETRYELIDPLRQSRLICNQQVVNALSPTAYSFYRPLPAALTPKSLLQFTTRGHRKELLVILLAGVASTIVGMVTPQAMAILIDHAIPAGDRKLLVQIAIGLLATALGGTLFQMTQGFALQRLETFADSSTQAALWDRLLKLRVSFFRQYATGDLSARVSAVSQIRQKLSSTMLKSLFSGVFSLLNLGLLFYYSVPLALVALFVALINVAVTIVSGKLTLEKTRPLLEKQGHLFGVMVQLVNGVAKFRVAGAENRAFAYWGKQYSTQLKLVLGTQGIEDNLAVVNKLLASLTPIALFACATFMLQQQSQSVQTTSFTGTFLAFNAAFGTFISGATSLSTTVVEILQILPLWEQVQPILQAVPEVDEEKADPGRLSGRFSIDRAMFRYRPEGSLILNDVSIHAEPGEFIALVGPSGSGKSTLLRLLLGFDLPESGTIHFDGKDLAGLDLNAVRRQLGVVMQNSRLMAGSIFENIAGNALISMDEAWEAARMAGFAADIEAMPMGLHTIVSEGGSNLSGGQRQRLLIARSLALRPHILLFDEATSALDNRTQAIVSASLDRLKVTRIVVAHRLSTIRNADRIYVLEQGRLVQVGSFDELAQQPGLFKQLVDRQHA
jgi:NHLM bacteriocin system ABC transporter ATP-binding protein